MIDIIKRLRKTEDKISESEMFLEHGLLSLCFFEIKAYKVLLVTINREYNRLKSLDERKEYIWVYRALFLSEKRKLTAILKNIYNRTLTFKPMLTKGEMTTPPLESFKYNEKIDEKENLFRYAEKCIKHSITSVNEQLYLIKHYPHIFYNRSSSYIGGDFNYRYEPEILSYERVCIIADNFRHFSLYTSENNSSANNRSLLNIIAFLNGRPNFEFTNNRTFNQKIDDLYMKFDLLDLIRLRDSKYLRSDEDKSIYLELPIIKKHPKYNLVAFKKMPHEMIFELYHASLKQFEPLPRCVFLYRVFEYAADNHYKTAFHPTNYKPEDALEYYLNCALNYNPNPLFYTRYHNHKRYIQNLFNVLKEESQKIFNEWSNNHFLQNKSKGEIVYLTGRNFTVHGGNGERNMQYDYDKNYIHINNINIVLELIARYVIELLNPNIRGIVERKKQLYITDQL